jgi:hypothetical protein
MRQSELSIDHRGRTLLFPWRYRRDSEKGTTKYLMFWSMCWQGYISRMDAAYAFGAGTTFLAHLYFGAGSRKARRVQGYSNFYFLFIIWAESLMIPFICMKRYKNKNESYVLSAQRFVIHLYLSSLVLFSVCTVYLSVYAAFRFSIHVKRISSLNILFIYTLFNLPLYSVYSLLYSYSFYNKKLTECVARGQMVGFSRPQSLHYR